MGLLGGVALWSRGGLVWRGMSMWRWPLRSPLIRLSVKLSSLPVAWRSRCRAPSSLFNTMSACMSPFPTLRISLCNCKPSQLNAFLYKLHDHGVSWQQWKSQDTQTEKSHLQCPGCLLYSLRQYVRGRNKDPNTIDIREFLNIEE